MQPSLFSMHVCKSVIGAHHLFRLLYSLSQVLCTLTLSVQAEPIWGPTGGHQICIASAQNYCNKEQFCFELRSLHLLLNHTLYTHDKQVHLCQDNRALVASNSLTLADTGRLATC